MLKHFITTIDYAKLIEMQARQAQTKISEPKSKKLYINSQVKTKQYNSVRRHH